MSIQDFINNFAFQLDETDASEITLDTVFKDLIEWSSLTTLSIIAMCDEEYGVKISGDDIKKSSTIGDLFNLVMSRI
jgi:acyl carrier protein